MHTVEIQTLIDITETGVNRPHRDRMKEYDQQRNFITLKQCLELRSNISYNIDPIMEIKDLKNLEFGSKYKGKQAIWTFRFTTDRHNVYADSIEELGLLINDLHGVPIIQNLTESINIDKPIFDLKNLEYKNTLIKALKGIF